MAKGSCRSTLTDRQAKVRLLRTIAKIAVASFVATIICSSTLLAQSDVPLLITFTEASRVEAALYRVTDGAQLFDVNHHCASPSCSLNVPPDSFGSAFPAFNASATLSQQPGNGVATIDVTGVASFTPVVPGTPQIVSSLIDAGGQLSIYAAVPNGTLVQMSLSASSAANPGAGVNSLIVGADRGGVTGPGGFSRTYAVTAGPASITTNAGTFFFLDTVHASGAVGVSGEDGLAKSAWFTASASLSVFIIPPPVTGTVAVSTNLSAASFSITGPANYMSAGRSFSATDAPPGNYTITWGAVAGFVTPTPSTQTLTAGGSIIFTDTYVPNPSQCTGGVAYVTTNLNPGNFTVAGPDVFSGTGTAFTQVNLDAGAYTITYGNVAGYNAPAGQTQTLSCGASVTFTGTYVALPPTGTISVTTNLAAATFTLTGPATYSGGGVSFIQTYAPPGDYSIVYNAVSGYVVPPSTTQTLVAAGMISFNGSYTIIQLPPAPTITAPHDLARPLSRFVVVTGLGSPTRSIDILVDNVVQTIVPPIPIDADGGWEVVVDPGPGTHQINAMYDGDTTLSNTVNVILDAPRPPTLLVDVTPFLFMRKADIIVGQLAQSFQNRLYGPNWTHVAIYTGSDNEGTPLVAEAVTADEAFGFDEVREIPLDVSLMYQQFALRVSVFRPRAPYALSRDQRDSVASWLKTTTANHFSYWNVITDLGTPIAKAWFGWEALWAGLAGTNPSLFLFGAALFSDGITTLDANKHRTDAFICSTLVWRAYIQGTSGTLDLSVPNNMSAAQGSVFGWITDPLFLSKLAGVVVVPETFVRSPKLQQIR